MMVIFFFAALLVCVFIVLGVRMSLALHTCHTFKCSHRVWKSPPMRGAIIASPYLHDAIFEKSGEHHHFWSTEIECDEAERR